jgi:hypothetical protein
MLPISYSKLRMASGSALYGFQQARCLRIRTSSVDDWTELFSFASRHKRPLALNGLLMGATPPSQSAFFVNQADSSQRLICVVLCAHRPDFARSDELRVPAPPERRCRVV